MMNAEVYNDDFIVCDNPAEILLLFPEVEMASTAQNDLDSEVREWGASDEHYDAE